MKILVLVTIIFDCAFSFSALAANTAWHLVRHLNGVESWRYQDNIQVTGQRQILAQSPGSEWRAVTAEHFLALHQAKKHVLDLIGVHDWQLAQHSLVWEKQQGIFRLAGTYQDHRNQTIYFLEVHLLRPDQSVQLLYTAPITWENYQLRGEEFLQYVNGQSTF